MDEPLTRPMYTDDDLRYVCAQYRTLEDLCTDRAESAHAVRNAIAAGLLPKPTYELPDGTELFTPDFFALLDAAGALDHLRQHFLSRHRRAAQSAGGPTSSGEKEWENYVSGIYGACLREVTPEAMVAKEQLIWRIDILTANARPEDDSWVAQLREAVDALDSVERPFTDYDRQRWGGTSRDSHITAVRETYL